MWALILVIGGGIKRWFCLTSDVCLYVCLSVAYIGPKSRTERPRKTKIDTEVAHVTRDSDNTFRVKRSRSPGRFGWFCWQAKHGNTVMVIGDLSICVHDVYRVTTCWPGRRHIVAAARLQLVFLSECSIYNDCTVSGGLQMWGGEAGCTALTSFHGPRLYSGDGQWYRESVQNQKNIFQNAGPLNLWDPLCLRAKIVFAQRKYRYQNIEISRKCTGDFRLQFDIDSAFLRFIIIVIVVVIIIIFISYNFYPLDVYVSAVFATAKWLAGWLAGWLDVTRLYCINTAKPILKLFRPSDSPIILVFWPLAPIPIPRVTTSAWAINTRGWEKLAIFDGNRRLSRKRCEIGQWLQWNVNRKSWVPDRIVSFTMTLSGP